MTGVALSPQLKVTLHGDFETTTGRLRAALRAGGFTILHQTNIADMTGSNDYVALHPSVLIGVYAPQLVYRAFVTAPASALLQPLTFMVSHVGDELIEVSLLDPRTMFDLLGSHYLQPIAQEMFDLAMRILDALERP